MDENEYEALPHTVWGSGDVLVSLLFRFEIQVAVVLVRNRAAWR